MAYSPKTDWKLGDTVQPADMNRIEGGIKELDTNKANTNLSNVPNSTFSSKAKASGLEVPAYIDTTSYVSPNGNDTTGDGTAEKPFKTLQHAVNSFPASNPTGAIYHIVVTEGTYEGFILRSNKHIWISPQGNVTLGKIFLYNGFLHIQDSLTLNDGAGIFNAATLIITQAAITKPVGSSEAAVMCRFGGKFIVTDTITINSSSVGVDCVMAQAFINNMVMNDGLIGIACACAQVNLGAESISAATKYVVTNSGRIYVDSQTIVQQ